MWPARKTAEGADAWGSCKMEGASYPLEEMLKVYYKNKKRGYDENGHPTEEKLKEFGLGLGLGYNPFFL